MVVGRGVRGRIVVETCCMRASCCVVPSHRCALRRMSNRDNDLAAALRSTGPVERFARMWDFLCHLTTRCAATHHALPVERTSSTTPSRFVLISSLCLFSLCSRSHIHLLQALNLPYHRTCLRCTRCKAQLEQVREFCHCHLVQVWWMRSFICARIQRQPQQSRAFSFAFLQGAISEYKSRPHCTDCFAFVNGKVCSRFHLTVAA
jgi:hypothetical protein